MQSSNSSMVSAQPSSQMSVASRGKSVGGGYSKLHQAKNEANQRELMEKLETEKYKERNIIKEKKQREQEKERRLAEERLRKINEDQDVLRKKKEQQKDFYMKFLRQTAETNLKKVEEKRYQNIQQIISANDSQAALKNAQIKPVPQANTAQFAQILPKPQAVTQPPLKELSIKPSTVRQPSKEREQQQPALGDGKFQTKLLLPKFHSKEQPYFQASALPAPIKPPETQEQEKKFLDTMNGLDLELSQSQALWKKFNNAPDQQKQRFGSPGDHKKSKQYGRGDYLESLDLNIGFESIQKLQDDWQKPEKQRVSQKQQDKYERDSLDSDEDNVKGGKQKQNDLQRLNEIKGGDTDWLEQSIKQSVCQWKATLAYHQRPEGEKVKTWIDQELEKAQVPEKEQIQQKEKVKTKVEDNKTSIQQENKEDEFTFGQKLQKLDENFQKQQQSQQLIKPPKPGSQAVTNRVSNHRLGGADDTKSSVSKISRASSKTKLPIAPTSGPIILSREEELRQAKEKKERLDSIKRQYSQAGGARAKSGARANSRGRKSSPTGATTKCTRDEDINIEEFMKDDLRQINMEEEKLQKELIQIHKKNLTKHDQVVSQNKIDTSIQNTEQLIRKLVNAPASTNQSSENQSKSNKPQKPGFEEAPMEEQIEESLENLDNLLEGLKKGNSKAKEQEIAKLGKKYNLIPQNEGAFKTEEAGGYGKKAKQNAFEYAQQPSKAEKKEENARDGPKNIPPNMGPPKKVQEVSQPIQENPDKNKASTKDINMKPQLNPAHNPPQQNQVIQPPIQQQQFQPFNNMDVIANLYSQQQKLQQNLQYLQMQQQQNPPLNYFGGQQPVNGAYPFSNPFNFPLPTNVPGGLPPQLYDPYSYNISGVPLPTTIAHHHHQQPQTAPQQQQSMEDSMPRNNRDLIKMRKLQQQQQQMVETAGSSDADFYQNEEEEDDNKQRPMQKVPSAKNITTKQQDQVRVNPKFNMKILFDE